MVLLFTSVHLKSTWKLTNAYYNINSLNIVIGTGYLIQTLISYPLYLQSDFEDL